MTDMQLEGRLCPPVDFDVCTGCQAFWFDMYKSPQLAAASTLKLMKFISEHPPKGTASLFQKLRCPRCGIHLLFTHDFQRHTKFNYWRCEQEHGRFIGFFDFLREKDYIHPLSQQQINEFLQNIQTVNCSNCGAPIDLTTSSSCAFCGSPLSLLDMHQPQRMLNELKEAAAPTERTGANLPVELARAKHDVAASFALLKSDPDWWSDVSSSGLVPACLSAVARWMLKSEM